MGAQLLIDFHDQIRNRHDHQEAAQAAQASGSLVSRKNRARDVYSNMDCVVFRNMLGDVPDFSRQPSPFFQNRVDEIQKGTPLLEQIKIKIDDEKKKCLKNNRNVPLMYILTGSNQFELQKAVAESLAGRVAILTMSSLANNEIEDIEGNIFNPDLDIVREKYKRIDPKKLYKTR